MIHDLLTILCRTNSEQVRDDSPNTFVSHTYYNPAYECPASHPSGSLEADHWLACTVERERRGTGAAPPTLLDGGLPINNGVTSL